MAFFLVSGFVIYYSSCGGGRQPTAKRYFVSRIRRIYPIFCFALLSGYLLQCLTAREFVHPDWVQLAGNLLMLQDNGYLKSGVWFGCFGGNGPLWSLSYEVWFYILFFLVIRLSLKQGNGLRHVVGAASLIAAVLFCAVPNAIALYLSYFITWWSGVELAREFDRRGHMTFKQQWPVILWLIVLAGWWTGVTLYRHWHLKQALLFGVEPVLQLRHVCAAIALMVLGIAWAKARFVGFRPLLGWGVWMAPISYGLYVLHYPLLIYLENFGHSALVNFALTSAIVIPLAYLLEVVLQKQINLATDRFFGLRQTPAARRVSELHDAPTPP